MALEVSIQELAPPGLPTLPVALTVEVEPISRGHADFVTSTQVDGIVVLTRAAFLALATKDPTVLYIQTS